ncbi:MAG: PepSY domain-containing protein [Desertimonas sp.]
MNHRTRLARVAAVTGLGLGLAGGVGVAAAAAAAAPQTADTTPTTEAAEDAGTSGSSDTSVVVTDEDSDDVAYTSSVTIDVTTRPTSAELAAVATVSAAEAIDAALADTPGTVTSVRLRSHWGNVVWSVDVVDDAGAMFDVIVDAGNADVLLSAADAGGGRGDGGWGPGGRQRGDGGWGPGGRGDGGWGPGSAGASTTETASDDTTADDTMTTTTG